MKTGRRQAFVSLKTSFPRAAQKEPNVLMLWPQVTAPRTVRKEMLFGHRLDGLVDLSLASRVLGV